MSTSPKPQPPVAAEHPHETCRHGRVLRDPYHWLRAENWQQVMREPETLPDEIRRHLEAENAYADAILAPTADLQHRLLDELQGRLVQDDSGVPTPDGPFEYYARHVPGGEHPLYCRRALARDATEQVLIDGNAVSAGHDFFRLAGVAHSPDHRYLAYTVDTTGGEAHAIRVRDLKNGNEIDTGVTDAQPTVVWGNDSATLYYIELDANHRPCRVRRHRLGATEGADELIHEDTDPRFYLSLEKSQSRRLILITAHDHSDTTVVHAIDADDAASAARLIVPKQRGLTCEVAEWRGTLIIRTNTDGAEDFKIVEAPLDGGDPAQWRELVPHQPGRPIVQHLVLHDWLVRRERIDGLPRIVVRHLGSGEEHEIGFEDPAFSLTLGSGYEFETSILRFHYSSPRMPEETYDYDMATRARTLRKRQKVSSGHDPSRYVVERLQAPSHDGQLVPVTVLRLKDTPLDGAAPLWLTGYGAYGISIPDGFEPNRFSLVDRGFVFALAHIRGGMELGYRWYRDGKLEHKTNTFHDMVAAAERLIETGYTTRGNIVLNGRSAGGLLVGAVLNMRPDLFRAVIAEVPFVDVLNTMSDASLPLTPPEWDEWGNPIDDPDAFRRIAAYCPYTNVEARDYPYVLAIGGLTDPRVTYWEPAKWIARLRAHATDDNPKLLRINMSAGHAGSAGRFERLEERALVYAFALMTTGRPLE